MGNWGYETFENDSVMDFLQEYPLNGDLDKMDQGMADLTLSDVWRKGDDFDKLGVVAWLVSNEFAVDMEALKEALVIGGVQLSGDELPSWRDPLKREKAIKLEIEDIKFALENEGKGRKRKSQDKVDREIEQAKKESEDRETHIELPCHNIKIILLDREQHADADRWGGGSITSDAKEVCKHCEDPDCDMDCPEFGEYCTDRDPDMFRDKADERNGFLAFNGGVDAITSMILAHAMAGIDIETPAYVEGIETALDALGNNT